MHQHWAWHKAKDKSARHACSSRAACLESASHPEPCFHDNAAIFHSQSGCTILTVQYTLFANDGWEACFITSVVEPKPLLTDNTATVCSLCVYVTIHEVQSNPWSLWTFAEITCRRCSQWFCPHRPGLSPKVEAQEAVRRQKAETTTRVHAFCTLSV